MREDFPTFGEPTSAMRSTGKELSSSTPGLVTWPPLSLSSLSLSSPLRRPLFPPRLLFFCFVLCFARRLCFGLVAWTSAAAASIAALTAVTWAGDAPAVVSSASMPPHRCAALASNSGPRTCRAASRSSLRLPCVHEGVGHEMGHCGLRWL